MLEGYGDIFHNLFNWKLYLGKNTNSYYLQLKFLFVYRELLLLLNKLASWEAEPERNHTIWRHHYNLATRDQTTWSARARQRWCPPLIWPGGSAAQDGAVLLLDTCIGEVSLLVPWLGPWILLNVTLTVFQLYGILILRQQLVKMLLLHHDILK